MDTFSSLNRFLIFDMEYPDRYRSITLLLVEISNRVMIVTS